METYFKSIDLEKIFTRVYLDGGSDDRYMDIFYVHHVKDKDNLIFRMHLYNNHKGKCIGYINILHKGKLFNVMSITEKEYVCYNDWNWKKFAFLRKNKKEIVNNISHFVEKVYPKKERDSIIMHQKLGISKDTADDFGELMSEL